jgi:hypothetical protein
MTPAQRMEVMRFTDLMCSLLRYADKMPEGMAGICGPSARTARILTRRGFVILDSGKRPKDWSIRLTEAGREALERRRGGYGGYGGFGGLFQP